MIKKMTQLSGKKILIAGIGKTGISLTSFCKKKGADITVTDINKDALIKISEQKSLFSGIKKEIGYHNIQTFQNSDLIILSPGIPHNIKPVTAATAKGVKITGEIEFASQFIKTPVIAVTGTNGKTTVTTLIGEILKNCGKKVFVGGNIGKPLIDYVDGEDKADIIIAEISSFQLDTISTFNPNIAACLNISKDHLERYTNYSEYAASKVKIFANQDKKDTAIINGNDILLRTLTENIKSKKLFFYPQTKEAGSIINFTDKKLIFDFINTGEKEKNFINLNNIKLIGAHNIENIAAASLCALAAGANINKIQKTVSEFKGIKHRIEHIDTINNVAYYNDSKATNTDAVLRALQNFNNPLILIMGGIDKGGSFEKLKPLIKKSVKKLIAIGEAKQKIINTFADTASDIISANSLEEAVNLAHKKAAAGDAVLLSPGCASFDMFRNYADRGETFCKAVKGIRELNNG
ncbi:MAG: UDP-N-acetylmuramoyl-L-alanine--D-glutamate ligase [Deltaproteobacteria bacterium]|nr:UDP-N-acetylmuramoyl-L-alanine--D-glutamate ligase [Deltaproteobacteria bacterium]